MIVYGPKDDEKYASQLRKTFRKKKSSLFGNDAEIFIIDKLEISSTVFDPNTNPICLLIVFIKQGFVFLSKAKALFSSLSIQKISESFLSSADFFYRNVGSFTVNGLHS